MKTPDQELLTDIADSKIETVCAEAENSHKEIEKRKQAINEAKRLLRAEEKRLEDVCRKLWETTKEQIGNIAVIHGHTGGEDRLTEEDIMKLREKGDVVFNASYYMGFEAFKSVKDEEKIEETRKELSQKYPSLGYDGKKFGEEHVLGHAYTVAAFNELIKVLENKPKGVIRFTNFQSAQHDSKYDRIDRYFLKTAPEALARLGYVVEVECDYLPAKDYSGGFPIKGGGSSWHDSRTELRNPIIGENIKKGSEPAGVVYTEYGKFQIKEPFARVIEK